jgi:hypothetical protein
MSQKHSTAPQAVFVQLPVRKPSKWEFVEIDLQRFNLVTFSKLYRRVPAKGGEGTQFIPFPDPAFPEPEHVVRAVKPIIEEQGAQLREKLHGTEQLEHVQLVELTLARLVNAIAYRNPNQACDCVRQLFSCLELTVGKLTNELQTSRKNEEYLITEITSSAHASANENASGTETEVKHSVYFAWGEAVLGINAAAQAYETNFRLLERLAQDAEESDESFAVEASKPDGDIMNALTFLDPPGGNGFITQALSRRGGMSTASFEQPINEAKQRIAQCGTILADACMKHQELCHRKFAILGTDLSASSPLKLAENACADLARYQGELRVFRKTHPELMGPHEPGFEYVDADAFDEAMAYLPTNHQHAWLVGTRRKRLRSYVQRISTRLGNAPSLPDQLRQAIKTAQQLITAFEEPNPSRKTSATNNAPSVRQERKHVASAEAEPTYASVGESDPHVDSPPTASALESILDASRLDELCELVVCIGFVCTYQNEHPNGAKSTRGMLRVLVQLNRCTNEELMAYSKAINDRFHPTSEHVKNAKEAQKKQETSDRDWVYYQDQRTFQWRRRLARKGANRARALLTKHGLTSREIVSANKQIGQNYRTIYSK